MISQDSWFSWMIALHTAIIRFLTNSMLRINGILYVDCIERFQISRQKASVPFVIPTVLMAVTGPVTGLLGNRYGIENITIIGCVAAAFGIGANFFAEDINMVTLFYGVFFGLGNSTGSNLLPNILHKYFTKRFSSANGLSLAGASVGAMILPLMAKPLFDTYGGAGTYLLLGAISLNAIPSSLILKCANNRLSEGHKIQKKHSLTESVAVTTISSKTANSRDTTFAIISYKERKAEHVEVTTENPELMLNVKQSVVRSECITGSLPMTNQNQCNQTHRRSTDIANNHERKIQKQTWKTILKSLRILLSLKFVIISFVNGAFLFIYTSFFTVIVDLSLDRQATLAEGTYIQAILAFTDVFSRLSLGFLTDRGYMTLMSFMISSFIVWALAFSMFLWANNFLLLMLASGLNGIVSGGIMIHLPSICARYVDKKDLVFVMSSRYLWFSPMCLAVPLIIGHFRDDVGSYDGYLYLLICLCLVTSVLLYSIPYLFEREKARTPL